MEITLTTTIADDIAASLQNGSSTPLARRLLELATSKAYETDLITEREVMEILGFREREDLYEFFRQHDVRGPSYTVEDYTVLEDLLRLHSK